MSLSVAGKPLGFLAVVLVLAAPIATHGHGFLSEPSHAAMDAQKFQNELATAMGEALGCGGDVSESVLVGIEKKLLTIWNALDKDGTNRIDRRSLRYVVHRYFDRHSSFHIRGFEPSRRTNASEWGDADILSQRVPAYVEGILSSRHKTDVGFDLRDAAYMVATVQQLIHDKEIESLTQAFQSQFWVFESSLNLDAAEKVLEVYMVHWLMGEDQHSIKALLRNRSLLEESIPHWRKIVSMARGHAEAIQHQRQSNPVVAVQQQLARPGANAFIPKFSFNDLHRVVESVTTSFAGYWESECQSMKSALVAMDTQNTGRVPLSKFYSHALDTEWRFGESEEYLRELGALDETSWRGKQVVIANYIQGASNCIVSAPHYLVCCVNECEVVMGDIEVAVGSPRATPAMLLDIVSNMSAQTSMDDDATPNLQGSLTQQLLKIGATHDDGLVPLHGRLFAQWLHYAFPLECPFPHKVGTAAKLSPLEFGGQYLAQAEDMQRHALEANSSDAGLGREELQWMSQWSPEEELIAETKAHGFQAPWETTSFSPKGMAFVLVAGILAAWRAKSASTRDLMSSTDKQSHFV